MKKLRSLIVMLLVVTLVFSLGATAFASDEEKKPDEIVFSFTMQNGKENSETVNAVMIDTTPRSLSLATYGSLKTRLGSRSTVISVMKNRSTASENTNAQAKEIVDLYKQQMKTESEPVIARLPEVDVPALIPCIPRIDLVFDMETVSTLPVSHRVTDRGGRIILHIPATPLVSAVSDASDELAYRLTEDFVYSLMENKEELSEPIDRLLTAFDEMASCADKAVGCIAKLAEGAIGAFDSLWK